jgi:hypothetical protein
MRRSLIARLERLERKLKPELALFVIVAIPDFSEPVRYVSHGAAGYVWDRAPGLSSDAKCNTPRRFDISKVVQDLKECCHLFASLG